MNENEQGLTFIEEESIKPIENNEPSKKASEKDETNATLPSWDINPPFELIDRSE